MKSGVTGAVPNALQVVDEAAGGGLLKRDSAPQADVCVVVEGTYPYVTGGVSQWVQQLLEAHRDLTFHLVSIMPPGVHRRRYTVPDTVIGHTEIRLPDLPRGAAPGPGTERLHEALYQPLLDLQRGAGPAPVATIMRLLAAAGYPGSRILLDSRAAWELTRRVYEETHPVTPFLSFFWGWRTLLSGLFTILMAKLPPARVYHPVCTGYAGLLAARAHLETGCPVMLTEHGIYTNERRIEIAMADWIHEPVDEQLSLARKAAGIRDLWVDWFVGYARACYECCSEIITLFEGNQALELLDGAPAGRLRIIPNGIDCSGVAEGDRPPHGGPPTIALIGRVVPIKDVKTFLRACAILRREVPGLRAFVLGPTDEDPDYFRQCLAMVDYLGLGDTVSFPGRVRLADYLPAIDLLVLTSISEAQPLVILEAGVHGIPAVATNVGACAEMLYGRSDEQPPLGPAGIITPLASPAATAEAAARLLGDRDFYQQCSRAIRRRLVRYYNKADLDRAYRALYERLRTAPRAA